ncbi:MAG: energy transducer TonB [Sulfuricurvum sp.]
MHRFRSFGASLAIHLLIAAAGWGAYQIFQKPPLTETRLAVTLSSYAPIQSAETPPADPQTPLPPQPKRKETATVPAQPIAKPAIATKPVSATVPAVSKPLQPTPLAVPAPAPLVAPAPRQEIKAAPPPPPAEEKYEEENIAKIRSILAERLKYPKNALRLKQQGEVKVSFTLTPAREVGSVSVTQSSGFEMLDDAACDLIETSASEFPKPQKSVRITVPIGYKIR